jgi:hypothetical protein
MTNQKSIHTQIQKITEKLIIVGLSVSQQYPSLSVTGKDSCEIAYSGMQDFSIALKNVEYAEIYNELNNSKNYNVKMIDGALIQFLYTYKDAKLVSHRLAFFPSPFLHEFQNEPELYENEEIYADIISKNILPVPIRFDYDLHHPKCHLTLGQFKNCRIPVCSPLTPYAFTAFILHSFYNTATRKFTKDLDFSSELFNETISFIEKQVLHIAIY